MKKIFTLLNPKTILNIWRDKQNSLTYKITRSIPLLFLISVIGSIGGTNSVKPSLKSGVIYKLNSSFTDYHYKSSCYGVYPLQHFEVLDSTHIGIWSQDLKSKDGNGQMSVIEYHKTDSTYVFDKIYNYDKTGSSRWSSCYNVFLGEYKYKSSVKYGMTTYSNVWVKDECNECNDGWGIIIEKHGVQSNSDYSGGWSYNGYLFEEYRNKYPRSKFSDY